MRNWLWLGLLVLACTEATPPPSPVLVGTPKLTLAAELAAPDTVARSKRMVARLVRESELAPATPMSQQLVHFRVVKGGGTLFTNVELTNTVGEVRYFWRLGTLAGQQIVEAYWIDQTTGDSAFARDTTTARPDTASQLAVNQTPVTLLVGERFALSSRVLGVPRDRYGNEAVDPIWYAVEGGRFNRSGDTVWATQPGRDRGLVVSGRAVAPIQLTAYAQQLEGGRFDVTWMCAHNPPYGRQRANGSVVVGQDSSVFTTTSDSIVYAPEPISGTIGRMYMTGSKVTHWSDGLIERREGIEWSWSILREAQDTVFWGTKQTTNVRVSVRTSTGWAGGVYCESPYLVAHDVVVMKSR